MSGHVLLRLDTDKSNISFALLLKFDNLSLNDTDL